MKNPPLRMSYAEDRITVGENDITIATRYAYKGLGSKPPLIFCHGAGGNPKSVWDYEGNRELLTELARDFVVVIGDIAGLYTFGNDAALSRVSTIRTYLSTTFGHPIETPMGLVGQSMGGGVSLAYANRFPDRVAFVAGQIPLISISDVMAARPDLVDEIDAAYGGDYSDSGTDGVEHSPIHFVDGGGFGGGSSATLDPNLPIKIWSASNDTVVRPGPLTSFLGYRPQTEHTSVGALGHTQAAIDAAVPDTLAWCRSHLGKMMELL